MNFSPASFFIAYILTNIIEFFPLHFLSKKPFNSKIKALLITNTITLPVVWIMFPLFFNIYLAGFLLIEALVVLAEACLLKIFLGENLKNAFKISFFMNLLSAAAGLFI